MTLSPGLRGASPSWSVTDDDDRHQRPLLVCPPTLCRRASNDCNCKGELQTKGVN